MKTLASILFFLVMTSNHWANAAEIKAFKFGSYQQILTTNANKGFVMAIWSIDCASCIKDMELLSKIHQERPDLKMIMVSTDDPSANDIIQKLLSKYKLTEIENWVFAEDNTQKLQYEIDPGWYSEIPRTYFFGSDHQREAVSGEMKMEDFKNRFLKLKI